MFEYPKSWADTFLLSKRALSLEYLISSCFNLFVSLEYLILSFSYCVESLFCSFLFVSSSLLKEAVALDIFAKLPLTPFRLLFHDAVASKSSI